MYSTMNYQYSHTVLTYTYQVRDIIFYRILYASNGGKRIGDNVLVALTLMIAESRPKDKDIIIKVIVNLINKDNLG